MKGTVSIAIVLLAAQGWTAGAMGHNALGAITANRILNGTYAAPEELKQALQNPQAKQAFIGGSIGPDLFPGRTHRGNQSQFAQQMLQNARQQMHSANSPASEAKAAEALAFAYGWFAHVAADLNVHPKVNSIVGDTYDYNNAGEKTTHAALEAQLYAYLKRVAGADEKFDARFPSEFIARAAGTRRRRRQAGDFSHPHYRRWRNCSRKSGDADRQATQGRLERSRSRRHERHPQVSQLAEQLRELGP